MKPHNVIGDAARMDLVDREFHLYLEKFGEQLKGYLKEYECRKVVEKSVLENGNWRC